MERRKRFETRGRNFILDRFKTMCYLSVEQFPGNSNLNGKNFISIVLKGQVSLIFFNSLLCRCYLKVEFIQKTQKLHVGAITKLRFIFNRKAERFCAIITDVLCRFKKKIKKFKIYQAVNYSLQLKFMKYEIPSGHTYDNSRKF